METETQVLKPKTKEDKQESLVKGKDPEKGEWEMEEDETDWSKIK